MFYPHTSLAALRCWPGISAAWARGSGWPVSHHLSCLHTPGTRTFILQITKRISTLMPLFLTTEAVFPVPVQLQGLGKLCQPFHLPITSFSDSPMQEHLTFAASRWLCDCTDSVAALGTGMVSIFLFQFYCRFSIKPECGFISFQELFVLCF